MRRLRIVPTAVAIAAVAGSLLSARPAIGQDGTAAPDGMVYLPAVEKQPIGMDRKAVESFLLEDVGTSMNEDETRWKNLWETNFLLGTPRHEVSVPELFFARYELTNAQWKVFIDSPRNQRQVTTGGDVRTLGAVTQTIWPIDPETQAPDFQAAWFYLMTRNWDVLAEHLNPEGKEDWDPRAGQPQAHEVTLPDGLHLDYARIPPPTYWRDAKKDWWRDGSVPAEELDRPVRGVSFLEGVQFCRWAGYHLPLEVEWERAARGADGRRFPWGDEWKPTAAVYQGYNKALMSAGDEAAGTPIGPNGQMAPPHPATVDSFGDFATPEGVHHLVGNVSEWIMDRLWLYPGTTAKNYYRGQSHLARGSNYTDKAETLLAAERTWDVGSGPLPPGFKPEGFGLRVAAYPNAAKDLTLQVALALNDAGAREGPALWMPTPPGLTEKERRQNSRDSKKQHLTGVSHARTAGVLTRAAQPTDTANHVYVNGPAKGVAVLPAKGYLKGVLKDRGSLAKLVEKGEQAVFLGVLVATENATIQLVDHPGPRTVVEKKKEVKVPPNPVPITFGEGADELGPLWAFDWVYGYYYYPLGALLVLRGEYVAVYAADYGQEGSADRHLLSGEPLGYLPGKWKSEWVKLKETGGSAEMQGDVARISTVLAQLEVSGEVPASGARGALVTIEVPVTYSDE